MSDELAQLQNINKCADDMLKTFQIIQTNFNDMVDKSYSI